MGWIFYKPTYERMALVDKEDLESDPGIFFVLQQYQKLTCSVVCFQHNYYSKVHNCLSTCSNIIHSSSRAVLWLCVTFYDWTGMERPHWSICVGWAYFANR